MHGTLTIRPLADDRFDGDWNLPATRLAEILEHEYIHGTGKLEGTCSNGVVRINLNPESANGNWVVESQSDGDHLEGTLSYVNSGAVSKIGRFEATRVMR